MALTKIVFTALCLLQYSSWSKACTGLQGVPSIPAGGLPSIPSGGASAGKGGGSKPKCIHMDANVLMADGTSKRAGDLIIGDRLWNGEGQSTPVVMFPKPVSDKVQDFVRFQTQNGHGTTLTPDHAVFARECGSEGEDWPIKRSNDLMEGDCVPTVDGGEDRVVSVELLELAGRIQPITESGKLAVDGVVVSCYDYVGKPLNQQERHAPYEPMRALYGWAEKIYYSMSNEEYAIGILDGLIQSLGLEKLYS